MTGTLTIFLNGQYYCIKPSSITLFDFVRYFDFKDSLLVLEYNGLICNEANWHQICLKDQDKVEIVTLVGGG